jgi:hypothetical protein
MTILSISNDNYITAFNSPDEMPGNSEAQSFSTFEELSGLAANWPASRLVEIWNNLPDAQPVKKFTDQKTGLNRIWKALQSMGNESVGEVQPTTESNTFEAESAPEMTPTNDPGPAPAEPAEDPEPLVARTAEEPQTTPQVADVAPVETEASEQPTGAEATPTAAPKPKRTREDSKTAAVVALLKREGGITLTELMTATGWQKHSVRGFLSGTIGKKMGLTLVSVKRDDGERVYSVAQ